MHQVHLYSSMTLQQTGPRSDLEQVPRAAENKMAHMTLNQREPKIGVRQRTDTGKPPTNSDCGSAGATMVRSLPCEGPPTRSQVGSGRMESVSSREMTQTQR